VVYLFQGEASEGALMQAKWARTAAVAGLVCATLALSGCWLSGRLDTKDIQVVPPRPETTATPDAGAAAGSEVATELVTVPNVIGKYYDEGAKILDDAGLWPVDVSVYGPVDEDAGEIGKTYRQTPKAGEQVPAGTKVELRSWYESQ
jgi:hypothetical protein